jgi:hypothetical protein
MVKILQVSYKITARNLGMSICRGPGKGTKNKRKETTDNEKDSLDIFNGRFFIEVFKQFHSALEVSASWDTQFMLRSRVLTV